nr:7955_t:CDS:2 [Entrophospora candida]
MNQTPTTPTNINSINTPPLPNYGFNPNAPITPIISNLAHISNPSNPNNPRLPPSIQLPMQQQPNPAIKRQPITGKGILKVLLFFEYLAAEMFPAKKDIAHWKRIVSEFFSEEGRFIYLLRSSTDFKTKIFDLPTPIIARFFQVNFDSGVNTIQITMSNIKESQHPISSSIENNFIIIIEAKSQMIYNYNNGSRVVFSGKLRIKLSSNTKIEAFEFYTDDHIEYLPRNSDISSPIGEYGITMKTLRCLEVAEIVLSLNDIISTTIEQKKGPQPSAVGVERFDLLGN